VQVVFALWEPKASALAADLGLYQAGWKTTTAERVALFLYGTGAVTPEYQNIIPRTAVDFVQIEPIATSQGLWAAALAEGTKRASSDALLALVEGLFQLIGSRRFTEIDLLLQTAEPSEVAPEVSVGLLRVTSNYEGYLRHWRPFLQKTKQELKRRGLPSDPILVGLNGSDDQLDQHP
jgi:hypothetical protein